jgi:putative oxidoreductase
MAMFDAVAKNTLVPLVLRLGLAAIFTYHGATLIKEDWGAGWMNKMPEPAPAPLQLAVAWGQLIGGIAMLLGFLTRLAALGLIAVMGGAIYLVHLPKGFDIRDGGYEYNILIIAVCIALVLMGPGTVAVDRFFRIRRRQ